VFKINEVDRERKAKVNTRGSCDLRANTHTCTHTHTHTHKSSMDETAKCLCGPDLN